MVLLSCLQAGKRQDGARRVSGAEFTADFLVQAVFPHGKQIAFTHCLPSILLPGADITEFKSTLKSTSKTEKAYARTRTHAHIHTDALLFVRNVSMEMKQRNSTDAEEPLKRL